jgi:hypothetical protein
VRRWFEDHPELFASERQGFEALGFSLDQMEFEDGRVIFRGIIVLDGDDIALIVVYPDSFPYLRPEVYAPELTLGRHQNPFRGNLCLLDRSSRAWDVGMTGAWLVEERVPYLLDLVKAGKEEDMRRAEAPQGEPMSRYFPHHLGTAVFVPDAMLQLSPDVEGGSLRLSVGEGEEVDALLRTCVTEVRGPSREKARKSNGGPTLARADPPLLHRFGRTALSGTWVRLEGFPSTGGTPPELWEAARAAQGYEEPHWQNVRGGRLKVVGIVAREEVRQGEWEDAWIFMVRLKSQGRDVLYLARGERLSISDLGDRIPSLKGLQEKTVALTGLGAVGATIAEELARSLIGELRVVDHDDVEAGTIVRWPVGVPAVGHAKTAVVGHGLPSQYPYTKVQTFGHHIGAAPPPGEHRGASEVEVMEQLLDGADLLTDATAELGVQYYLAAQAQARHLPQVYAWMTEGGWGGAVARVVPGKTGCWYCLQWHFEDSTIPLPPREELGTLQPRGCTERTFTGSSFDALPIVAQTVRVIAQTLLHGRSEIDAARDVFVCSQRRETDGLVTAPTWQAFPLVVHPNCEWCSAEV